MRISLLDNDPSSRHEDEDRHHHQPPETMGQIDDHLFHMHNKITILEHNRRAASREGEPLINAQVDIERGNTAQVESES